MAMSMQFNERNALILTRHGHQKRSQYVIMDNGSPFKIFLDFYPHDFQAYEKL